MEPTRGTSETICWRTNVMKKFLLGTVALVALGATVPALAADLAARPAYTKAPAYMAPIYNWTGFYIGGHVGGGFDGTNGFTGGAGLEYMFAQNWSAKVEYQYYDFGKTNFVTPAVLTAFGSTRNDEHTVKAGINYRFNWGGPVVAKY